jgi:beta-lactamase superfamily II metal-dependent hydrolase
MNNLRFYNVWFGQCSLISSGDSCLLVDCGSLHPVSFQSHLTSVLQDVNQKVSFSSDAQFLISHFHEDHVNQIINLKNGLFDHVYVRNVYRTQVSYHMSLLTLILAILNHNHGGQNAALFELLFIKKLAPSLKNQGDIVFVRKGAHFFVNNLRFAVLSPFHEGFVAKKQENIATKIADLLKSIDSISSPYKRLEDMGKVLVESYGNRPSVSKADINHAEIFDQVEEASRDLISSLEKTLPENYRSQLLSLLKALGSKKWEHSMNVTVVSEGMNPILLCGDESTADMKSILDDLYANIDHLYLIQTPHHGTPSHYVSFSCFSPFIGLASNGTYLRYGKPSCFYLRDFSEFYITNGNLKLKHKNCKFIQHFYSNLGLGSPFYKDFPF